LFTARINWYLNYLNSISKNRFLNPPKEVNAMRRV